MSTLTRSMHSAILAVALICAVGPAARAQQVQTVRSTSAPAWGTGLRLVEEVRIGALDGAEEYMFGSVDGVAVGREGAIFVADGRVPIIRMYDARGKFVRNVGGKGAGPGEYEAIGGIRALADGRISIWDNRTGRITIYTPAGEFASTHRVELTSRLFGSDLFEVDRADHFYIRTSLGRPGDGKFNDAWIHLGPNAAIIDTIPVPKETDPAPSFVLAGPSGYDAPFTRELIAKMGSNGHLITAHTGTYAFDQHRRGAPVLRIERSYTPLPVTRAERAEWQAWADRFERNARADREPVKYHIPDTKPAFSDLRTDSRGRIWVRRYVAAQSRPGPVREPGDDRPRRVWREPPTFDVFEADGRFLGTITFPFGGYMYDAADRHIWATVVGESDEEYVVRYRIEGAKR